MARKSKSGIKIKKSRQGSLRRVAKVKGNKKIPAKKLQQLSKSKNPNVRRKANFAKNARKFKKGGK